jgi:hypothetical protein
MKTFPHCSDEEGYGKFLDLHECYDKYINIKGVERVDYIGYIQAFEKLADIPKVFLAYMLGFPPLKAKAPLGL